MHSLPLYTSLSFSRYLNDTIVDIKKLGGICSSSFVVDDFKIIFTSIDPLYQELKICIVNRWCFIRCLLLIKV